MFKPKITVCMAISFSVCDICGKKAADIVCMICDSKQLCGECDTKWHSHPKRQNHQRQKLTEPPVPCGVTEPQGQQIPQRTGMRLFKHHIFCI